MYGRKGIKGFAGVVFATSLTACASVIDPVKPTTVDLDEVIPAQESWAGNASQEAPRTDWVESFQDENLTKLVNQARSDNPSLIRAMAQLDRALAQKNISRADLYPTLGASASVRRTEGGVGFNAGATNYNIGLSSSWEVDVINRIRDQIASDGLGAEATAADLAALELSVISRLATNWFSAIEAGLLVDLSADDIATQERSLRLTQRRFESGLTGSSDVRLARSAIANAQALEQSRLQQRDATLRGIQVIVREYPDADIALPDDLPALPDFTGAGTPERMLSSRPDIIAAEKRIEQAGLDVDVARKALYPRLSIDGTAGDQALDSLGDVLDLKSLAFSLTESLTAPIFQGGRLKSQVEAQKAQLAAQVETYVETVFTAYQEVENALDAEERLAAREAALRISRDEAVMAEQRLEIRYTEGLATILQLLDSQSRRLSAEGQLISARSERLSNRVRLHVALGGAGYTLPPGLLETEPVEILGIDLP